MLLLLVYRHRVVKSVVYHHRGRMVKEHDMIINIFHGFTEVAVFHNQFGDQTTHQRFCTACTSL